MNVYDAERMSEALQAEGMTESGGESGEAVDVLILNTCHIREKAAEKLYHEIGRISARAREAGHKPVIAVAGCVAQAEGAEIIRRAGAVDLVVGPQAYHRLPQLLEREWLGDAAGYLQDGSAIGRVLGSSPQRTAELARQGEALAADVAALPAMSLSKPRSRCPQCGHQLAWHENIPLLGWLRLGGKCSA